jgi:AraC family transcriptional regulator
MSRRLPGGQFYGEVVRRRALDCLHLTETRYAPGTRLPRHSHEHAYFCFIRRGTYREEYGDRQRCCGPFMLAFHPPEEVHAEHIDGEEVQSFNIELTPSWLRSAAPLDQPFDSRGGPLVGLAVRLLDEFEHFDAASPLIIEGLTLQLLGLCARCEMKPHRATLDGPAVPRWLLRVRELLTERCTDAFTLADLAAEAEVHPGYLAAAFRRHFGCTVGGYVRRQRVALACKDLAGSDAPLADIALRAGFADQSHFTRTFKRQIGLTPAAYRKLTARAAARSTT